MTAIGRNRSWNVAIVGCFGVLLFFVGAAVREASSAKTDAAKIEVEFGKHDAAETERDKAISQQLDDIRKTQEIMRVNLEKVLANR